MADFQVLTDFVREMIACADAPQSTVITGLFVFVNYPNDGA